jgi:hypothetical protein
MGRPLATTTVLQKEKDETDALIQKAVAELSVFDDTIETVRREHKRLGPAAYRGDGKAIARRVELRTQLAEFESQRADLAATHDQMKEDLATLTRKLHVASHAEDVARTDQSIDRLTDAGLAVASAIDALHRANAKWHVAAEDLVRTFSAGPPPNYVEDALCYVEHRRRAIAVQFWKGNSTVSGGLPGEENGNYLLSGQKDISAPKAMVKSLAERVEISRQYLRKVVRGEETVRGYNAWRNHPLAKPQPEAVEPKAPEPELIPGSGAFMAMAVAHGKKLSAAEIQAMVKPVKLESTNPAIKTGDDNAEGSN